MSLRSEAISGARNEIAAACGAGLAMTSTKQMLQSTISIYKAQLELRLGYLPGWIRDVRQETDGN